MYGEPHVFPSVSENVFKFFDVDFQELKLFGDNQNAPANTVMLNVLYQLHPLLEQYTRVMQVVGAVARQTTEPTVGEALSHVQIQLAQLNTQYANTLLYSRFYLQKFMEDTKDANA